MLTKTISRWPLANSIDLNPKLGSLSNHALIEDRQVVIDRIAKAIRSGELIGLAADYDCDGMGSCVLLHDCIRSIGGRAISFVASRFDGGYGLSDNLANKLIAANVRLTVTLDCGSSDHDRIDRLNSHGIDVVVIDHHLVPSRPLNVIGFLNPNKPSCLSEFKHMASGGLAWSVVVGLLREFKSDIDPKSYLELTAIATIGDVAPLTLDNRILTAIGLREMANTKRPGLRVLMDIGKLAQGQPITGRDISFRVCPMVNAPGRLGPPDIIIQLLMTTDPEEAKELGKQIEEIAAKRRLITEIATNECIAEVESNGYHKQTAIVLGSESYGHGIVGISAARLVDKYKVPICVIGSEGRGSLRGPPGSRLYDALVFSKDALLVYGGHQQAAGCRLDFTRLNEFRETFCRYFRENAGNLSPVDPEENILDLDPQDQLMAVVGDLSLLEPTGQANPKPRIRVQGKVKEAKAVKGNHLKLTVLIPGNRELGCFAISMGDRAPELINKTVTVIGDLRKNVWNGRTRAEMFVDSITS